MSENFDDGLVIEFEWDANKSKSNLAKHGFDFEDASQIFYGPVLLHRSDRDNEPRWIAIGSLEDRLGSGGLHSTRKRDPYHLGASREEK